MSRTPSSPTAPERPAATPATSPATGTAGGAPATGERRLVALLALATVAAAALRLPFLATQSLWFDETYTIHVIHAGSLGELWHRVGASESTPPLYYLLAWSWTHAVGSYGAAAVRTVSALASIAAVPVSYGALRRLVGRSAALATAALVAVSPLLGWYALDARAYGLLVLSGLLGVWAFGAALEATTPRRFALWALAAAAALWTHWFAGFLVLAEVVALLWLRREAWRGTLLAVAAAGLAVVPLIGLLREQTGDDRAAFIAASQFADRVKELVRQFAAGQNVPRTWLEAVALALALGALAVGVLLTARHALGPPHDARPASSSRSARGPGAAPAAAPPAAAGPHDRRADPAAPPASAGPLPARDGARALLALVAIGLLVPFALGATELYDRFNARNVLFLWPLAAALAAPALLRLRGVPLAALLALGVGTSLWTQTAWPYESSDWRTAIARVEERAPGRPFVAVGRLGVPVAALYLDRAPAVAPLSTRRAWLVVEPARSPGHRELRPIDPPLVAALLAAFPRHRETRVHAFRLIELSAPAPVSLDPAQLPDGALFPGQPRLVQRPSIR